MSRTQCSFGCSFRRFMIQQPFLAPESAPIADQVAVRADHPVAGDDKCYGIPIIGASNCTVGTGMVDGPRHVSIRGGLSIWDFLESLPDEFLKRRSLQKELEGEALAAPPEILVKLLNPFLHALREVAVIGKSPIHKGHGHNPVWDPGDLQGADGR